MLGLTQASLAEAAGISTTALNNIERGMADPKVSTLVSIKRALEAAGIQFLDPGEIAVGPGLALKGTREEGLRPEQLSAENDG